MEGRAGALYTSRVARGDGGSAGPTAGDVRARWAESGSSQGCAAPPANHPPSPVPTTSLDSGVPALACPIDNHKTLETIFRKIFVALSPQRINLKGSSNFMGKGPKNCRL